MQSQAQSEIQSQSQLVQQSDDEFSKPKRSRNKPKREAATAAKIPTTVPSAKSGKRAVEDDEPLYCYCQQVSYGEMVGCDGEHCEREWFHLPCTGLKELPKGEWYCDDCKAQS